MIRRLRIKFICVNMAIVTAMLLVIFGMVFHFTQDNLERNSIKEMEFLVQNRNPPPPGRPGEIPNKMMQPHFLVELTDAGAVQVIANSYYDLSDETLLNEIVKLAQSGEKKVGLLFAYRLRYHKMPIRGGFRIVFMDITDEIQTIGGLMKTCVLIFLVSLAVFFWISVLLARWAVRPVARAWEQQRQFVADASHELKTPLTVIMTNAELLQNAQYTDEERGRFLQGIVTVSGQMRELVESLLLLARADSGSSKMEFAPVSMSELTEEVLLLFEPVYFEQALQLTSEVEPELQVSGSREHLHQTLEILLDNGVKYSTPGGTVHMQLKRQGSHCLLTVASPGEEISKADLKNIFKRFYRIDQARSRNGSCGLGLSIAEGIVQTHGGKIWAESSGGINTFCVQLNLIT